MKKKINNKIAGIASVIIGISVMLYARYAFVTAVQACAVCKMDMAPDSLVQYLPIAGIIFIISGIIKIFPQERTLQ